MKMQGKHEEVVIEVPLDRTGDFESEKIRILTY